MRYGSLRNFKQHHVKRPGTQPLRVKPKNANQLNRNNRFSLHDSRNLISLPAASMSDVFGRKKILLFATFVFASAPFLYLFVTVWWQLALVRFYHGFATAIFVPVAEATIAEQSPSKKGGRISDFNSATYVGRGIAPFLGGAILAATNFGYATLFESASHERQKCFSTP